MARIISEEADGLFGKQFRVLDYGEVELIDYMGGDSRITEAARVSYKNTKTKSQDSFLIDYLLRNDHTSPFEQVVLTFRLKMPIFVARQWVRHRTARMNEVSGRYSIMSEEFYLPSRENLNKQSADNKQGRGEMMSAEECDTALSLIQQVYDTAGKNYEKLLGMGLAKEVARIVLPLSLYTEFYWQIDLHNLFHFLLLRLDSHAQLEIREYAKVLLSVTEKVCPVAVQAFRRHSLEGLKLSATEADDVIARLAGTQSALSERDARILGDKIARHEKRSVK